MECEQLSALVYKCTWSIPQFGVIYEKCSPNQKITSPVSEDLPFGDDTVTCRIMLFPKGTHEECKGSAVVAQFSSSGLDSHKLSFSCLMRCVSEDSDILDDLTESECAICGNNSSFGPPATCIFDLPEGTASLMISITFRPFSEERELMDNVKSGIFSFQTVVTSFIANSGTAAVAESVSRSETSIPRGFTQHDEEYIRVVTRPPNGNSFWTLPRWSVLLHVCIAFTMTSIVDGGDADLEHSIPSDEAKAVLFASCPPLRAKLAEERHTEGSEKILWKGILSWMRRFAKVTSVAALRSELCRLNQSAELVDVLVFAVDPASVSYISSSEVSHISRRLRASCVAILESSANLLARQDIESVISEATDIVQKGIGRQQQLRQRVSALVGYHTWHNDAEQCLSAGLEVSFSNPLEKAISTASHLLEVL